MSDDKEFYGFMDLTKELNKILDSTEQVMTYQEEIASDFVNDLLKLPKPISKIRKSGYTHLIRTFSYRRNDKKKDIEVGWGKYYGRFVEVGTSKNRANPHMAPLWNSNEKKYIDKIRKRLNLD